MASSLDKTSCQLHVIGGWSSRGAVERALSDVFVEDHGRSVDHALHRPRNVAVGNQSQSADQTGCMGVSNREGGRVQWDFKLLSNKLPNLVDKNEFATLLSFMSL